MSSLSPIKARKLINVLKKLGFVKKRQKGSHVFFEHPDGRVTSVPFHSAKEIGKGLLRAIFDQIKLSPKEFKKHI